MPRISVVIIAFNEEDRIGGCLESVEGIADEIVVVDSFSTDRTGQICAQYGARFIRHRFEGHIQQKNFALEQASFDHVLCLDADEALSPELRRSVLEVKNDWAYPAYCFNRLSRYCGKWIRHSTWYPSRKTRLAEKGSARWKGINPHDYLSLSGGNEPAWLKGDLLHYSYDTVSEHRQKVRTYAELASRAYYRAGRSSGLLRIIMHPFWRFMREYFIHLGLLDGYYGLVIAWLCARETYLKYKKLRDIIREEGAGDQEAS
jgi:glycosyltransferase involved in cell wall biosynthesis